MIFQVVLFVVFALTFATGLVALSKRLRFPALFLIVVGLLGGFFSIAPEYSTYLANYLGVGRGADLILYLLSLLNLLLSGLLLSRMYQMDQNQNEALRKTSVKLFQLEEKSKNENA
jgi:hypothetical protein